MSGGEDKHLRFFKVDGEKNEKMLSMTYVLWLIESFAMRHEISFFWRC